MFDSFFGFTCILKKNLSHLKGFYFKPLCMLIFFGVPIGCEDVQRPQTIEALGGETVTRGGVDATLDPMAMLAAQEGSTQGGVSGANGGGTPWMDGGTNSGGQIASNGGQAGATSGGQSGGQAGTMDSNAGAQGGGAYMSGAESIGGADIMTCGQVTETAGRALQPVDIIWVIDSSPSMGEEIAQVQSNINAFTQRIALSGLDVKVVMVASEADVQFPTQDFLGVCVPPPLSGQAVCPDVDSEDYFHARVNVHSKDALDKFIEAYPSMQSFLREYALKHIVFVTDDDAGWGTDAMEFLEFLMNAPTPGFQHGVNVHSVIDLVGYQSSCIFDDNCSCGEERGETYISLSESTMGTIYSICEEDWTPIFEALEEHVFVGRQQLSCAYDYPTPDEDRVEFTPEFVNVYWSENEDEPMLIPQVDSEALCLGDVGWYYDNPIDPTTIFLCPITCAGDEGQVRLEFGCRVVKR